VLPTFQIQRTILRNERCLDIGKSMAGDVKPLFSVVANFRGGSTTTKGDVLFNPSPLLQTPDALGGFHLDACPWRTFRFDICHRAPKISYLLIALSHLLPLITWCGSRSCATKATKPLYHGCKNRGLRVDHQPCQHWKQNRRT